MSTPQVIALISDLHLSLGAGWPLEDFHSDSQLGSLVDFLKGRFAGKRVDLVLLGDVFDFWQVVPDSDLTSNNTSEIDLTLDIAQLGQDLGSVANKHPKFFKALTRFSQDPNNRLVILAGNHDHPLVVPELQSTLKNLLVGRFNFSDRQNNLVFPQYHFYAVPQLGVYAEHGNQYERFNKYKDFLRFGPDPLRHECQGYGLVRLFWNRLENLDQDIDDRPEYWGSWFSWLRRHLRWGTMVKAWSWYQGYKRENRVEPITIADYSKEAALAVPSDTGAEHQTQPEILLDGENLNTKLLFSQDPMVEAAYRRLYQDDQGFRQTVDQILTQKFSPQPVPAVTPMPEIPPLYLDADEKLIHPSAGAAQSLILGEPLVRSLGGMFSPGQGPNLFMDNLGNPAYLDSQIYNLVIMGHTHDPRWESISNYPDKLYINTGTWTTRRSNGGTKTERTVILVEELDSKEVWVEGGSISDSGAFQTQKRHRVG
jgi:UDP-2,3-diacylglucosamine pyrophosphatase LpxH